MRTDVNMERLMESLTGRGISENREWGSPARLSRAGDGVKELIAMMKADLRFQKTGWAILSDAEREAGGGFID
ncbi:MAG: hypothetical protein ACLUOI_11720 [Eisenbergiella sp.]